MRASLFQEPEKIIILRECLWGALELSLIHIYRAAGIMETVMDSNCGTAEGVDCNALMGDKGSSD